MFNVTVLKMRDIIKYLVGIAITLIIIVCTVRYFSFAKNDEKEKENKINIKFEAISANSLTKCLDKTIPAMSNMSEEYNKIEAENENISNQNFLEMFLESEISSIKGINEVEKKKEEQTIYTAMSEKTENNVNEEGKEIVNNNTKETEMELAKTSNIQTEVVTQNPIKESCNVQYGSIKIKNETTYNLTDEILKPDIKIDNKNILIFHTHTCESYTPSEKYQYTQTR